jgi:O-antigen/teichoic acid export membrane protein
MRVPASSATLISYKAAADMVAKGVFFLVLILAARRLSTDAFGVLTLASTGGWFISLLTDLGLQLHLAREIARAPADAGGILHGLLRVRLGASAVAMTCVAAGLFVWSPPGSGLAVFLIVLAAVASSLVEFLNYGYRGLSRSELEASLNLAQRGLTLAGAAAALWIAPRLDVLSITLVAPPIAVFLYSYRLIDRLTATPSFAPAPRRLSKVAWTQDVLPMGAATILGALYFRVDVFLLGLWTNIDVVAHYNAVFRLVEALRLFPAAVLAVLLPAVFTRQDTRFVWQVSASLALFGAVVAVALYGAAPWLVEIAYGDRYAAAIPALRILLVTFPLFSLNYGLTHHLLGWNGQRAYLVICAAALMVNIGLNAWLIPRMAAAGAAWATFGTEVFLTMACVGGLVSLLPHRSPELSVQSRSS